MGLPRDEDLVEVLDRVVAREYRSEHGAEDHPGRPRGVHERAEQVE
jgi:hypothetical protein